jgi:uncharacterized protein YkwD
VVVAAAAALAGSVVALPGTAAIAATTNNASVQSAAVTLNAPVVGLAATPTGQGYWRAAADGGVLTAGDARMYGTAVGRSYYPMTAIAATPSGHGYWIADRRGLVWAFGDAHYYGSMAGKPLSYPIVGMAARPDGKGYWLVASDGGIFGFGAPFLGSMGGKRLNKPIVGMAATPSGTGYWLVASDGGIFGYNAKFMGSTGSIRLNKPITGMAAAPDGSGYTLVATDGGLFRFGASAPFYGSAVGACPGAPAVAVAMSKAARGYWIAFADARTYAFSPSSSPPKCSPGGATRTGKMQSDLFVRLNQERAARHLPAMSWDPTLANYATSWSANMASHGFRHSNIGALLGPYNYVGENIAAGSAGTTAGSLHNAWMHSDGHRENILAPGFTRVGIGAICDGHGGIWLTEDFARPASSGYPTLPSGPPPVNPIARPDSGSLTC